MKGLKVDAIVPWEVGIIIIFIGIVLVFMGNSQSKKKDHDIDKIIGHCLALSRTAR